jgi:hypothetical protein
MVEADFEVLHAAHVATTLPARQTTLFIATGPAPTSLSSPHLDSRRPSATIPAAAAPIGAANAHLNRDDSPESDRSQHNRKDSKNPHHRSKNSDRDLSRPRHEDRNIPPCPPENPLRRKIFAFFDLLNPPTLLFTSIAKNILSSRFSLQGPIVQLEKYMQSICYGLIIAGRLRIAVALQSIKNMITSSLSQLSKSRLSLRK